jgi:hypothetical protein
VSIIRLNVLGLFYSTVSVEVKRFFEILSAANTLTYPIRPHAEYSQA